MNTHAPTLLTLSDPGATDPAVVGAKAARLAALASAGFRVPAGVVIPAGLVGSSTPDDLLAAAREATAVLGAGPVAVRSSALAEDQADASFAGLYESVLDVVGERAIADAIETVRASARAARVDGYAGHDATARPIAVLIQSMVPAEAAGVAFTADPITGVRTVTVIDAVAGLGERLVAGEVAGERWTVTAEGPECESSPAVLDGDQATEIARLAREVEAGATEPQDIEWALAEGTLWLLQARPMTALPDQVEWTTDAPGWWRRDFRFGEWLPEPVTPLFESWFFPMQEAGFVRCLQREFGIAPEAPFHVLVNGWCYCSVGQQGPRMLLAFARHPIFMGRWVAAFATIGKRPAFGERVMAKPAWELYQRSLWPAYDKAVTQAEALVETATPERLIDLIDTVTMALGELTYPLVETLGYAGKAEVALATLYRRRLAPEVGGSHLVLLAGLSEPAPPPGHAVTSLDWHRPTTGELGVEPGAPDRSRHERLVSEREAAEAACRTALAGDTRALAQFDEFLDIAQRYAVIRERMAADLTLGWPVTRRALRRLADHLLSHGSITSEDDLFFLTREEIVDLVGPDATPSGTAASVHDRRQTWRRQSRLVAPPAVGKASHIAKKVLATRELMRTSSVDPSTDVLVGTPASAGVATGPVRVVRSPADFERVRPGDILVAPVTAPAWTPLFARIAAVVTDNGSALAHASLIAREYAIPAVVGTGDATARLRDGMVVSVDGARGAVTILGR